MNIVSKNKKKNNLSYSLFMLVFLIFTIVSLYPLIWLLLSSLKTPAELFGETWRLPKTYQWQNYINAWNSGISKYLISSVIVTLFSTILVIFLSMSCAYALIIFEFRAKVAVYLFIIGGLVLPPEVSLFPLFKTLNFLGIYNTYLALILPYTAFGIPFTTFLIRAYMIKIPYELNEAATMDGASKIWIFMHIYFPLCKPIIASASLIQIMKSWNEFIFALTFIESENLKTITIGMMSFANALRGDWSILMAGLVISILPILIVFLVLQRQFIGGLTQGAIK